MWMKSLSNFNVSVNNESFSQLLCCLWIQGQQKVSWTGQGPKAYPDFPSWHNKTIARRLRTWRYSRLCSASGYESHTQWCPEPAGLFLPMIWVHSMPGVELGSHEFEAYALFPGLALRLIYACFCARGREGYLWQTTSLTKPKIFTIQLLIEKNKFSFETVLRFKWKINKEKGFLEKKQGSGFQHYWFYQFYVLINLHLKTTPATNSPWVFYFLELVGFLLVSLKILLCYLNTWEV